MTLTRWWASLKKMGPVRIRHSSHDFATCTQSSHFVDLAGWQAKMASIGFWIPWRNAHKPHCRQRKIGVSYVWRQEILFKQTQMLVTLSKYKLRSTSETWKKKKLEIGQEKKKWNLVGKERQWWAESINKLTVKDGCRWVLGWAQHLTLFPVLYDCPVYY